MSDRHPAAAETGADDARGSGRTARTVVAGRVPDRAVPRLLALAALVAAFTYAAGRPGTIAGIATAAVWYALETPSAIGVGHVALVGLVPAGFDPFSVALVEAGFVALVLASAPRTARDARLGHAATVLVSAGGLGGLAWAVLGPAGRPLWMAAVASLAALAGGVYGLHRYGLVFVLDRAGRDRPDAGPRPDESTADPSTAATERVGSSPPDPDSTADADTYR
ncbi:hypothetical protein [Natrinema altunense]|uniref:DUF8163 domain-containing protein n=1 Tax=Natrinema altunense (strain JCM 12890 / CGMCC 1.3731 / AJ2) TaxID=1227494 RepID=L9ZGS7_NATA2|nr:hypothetical protein [Natrinema altunense]ELY84373.1 hypothetical protein C485_15506 [Natrinema altunense JCM 12890]